MSFFQAVYALFLMELKEDDKTVVLVKKNGKINPYK